jgi:16S rRNA (uracil1498-N3)-methyltransferase
MSVHRLWIEGSRPNPGDVVRMTGDEARHALKVKRLAERERVELLDGAGFVATGEVSGASTPGGGGVWLEVRVGETGIRPRVSPRVEVCSATPKGPRAGELVEQLSQVGAAAWRPLVTERGVVDPADAKLDRLRRVALESAKQCGRAWVMEIGEAIGLEAALAGGGTVVVADAGGGAYRAPGGAGGIRLIIGPEGGWSGGERDTIARAQGVRLACFGPHVMRIETAAVAGAAIALSSAC